MLTSDLEKKRWRPGAHIVVEERNGLVEAVHRAHIAVVNRNGDLVFSSGDPDHVTYTRSCLKPVQALPVLTLKAAEALSLTDMEIAIISGSHSGDDLHLATVRSILAKASLDESILKCGGHTPFDKDAAKRVGDSHSRIHDNCSGKHAGALALSRYMGWPMADYLSPAHPVNKEVLKATANLSKVPEKDIVVGVDGCGLPNLGLPISGLARMFCTLADPRDHEWSRHLKRISNAMMSYPHMVAGKDRFDTIVMEDHPGRVLSKAGAVGLQAMAVDLNGEWFGIAIKLEDGAFEPLTVLNYHIIDELGLTGGIGLGDRFRNKVVTTRDNAPVGSFRAFGRLKRY